MFERSVESIVDELESLGVKLTVTPRLDGTVRLNCWRTMNAWEHQTRINELLAEHVETNADRAAEIAKFVNERANRQHRSLSRTAGELPAAWRIIQKSPGLRWASLVPLFEHSGMERFEP